MVGLLECKAEYRKEDTWELEGPHLYSIIDKYYSQKKNNLFFNLQSLYMSKSTFH